MALVSTASVDEVKSTMSGASITATAPPVAAVRSAGTTTTTAPPTAAGRSAVPGVASATAGAHTAVGGRRTATGRLKIVIKIKLKCHQYKDVNACVLRTGIAIKM